MATRLLTWAIILSSAVSMPVLAQKGMANSGTWSGIIINSGCTAEEAFAEASKCIEDRGPGAKLVFYDDTTRHIYNLEPQDQATGHLGDSVMVDGTVHDNVIRVASIKLLTGIGLPVGAKAPDFSVRDQFGHPQSLAALKGKHGTVLLFFRSADW
jgi:hypothetical protein